MKAIFDPANRLSGFVAIVKANLSGWYVLLALLFMSMFLSGCEEDGIAVCPVDDTVCATEVTAVNVTCGLGAFNSIWLQLPDGKYLQPWANETATTQITAGARYKISFVAMEPDDRYNNTATCKIALPPAQAIRLLCINPLNPTND